jgi:hypothetical protein
MGKPIVGDVVILIDTAARVKSAKIKEVKAAVRRLFA